jgi:RHS repeat-associated protein
MQGAGGIGGILAITQDNQTGYPFADGNGNISHIHSSTDEVLASYIYDPYGNKLSQSGPWQNQPYQWSSKEHHQASGLVYYLYRFYNPETGRWLNRDPIEERGGINLYGFVTNNPVDRFDFLGLEQITVSDMTTPLAGAAVGGQIVANGKTLTRIGGTWFYISGNASNTGWKGKSDSHLLIWKKGDPKKKIYRLDYGHNAATGVTDWHHNQKGVATIRGLQVTNHSTQGAQALGTTISVFRWAGRAAVVGGLAAGAYDIYQAEDRIREGVVQLGGFAGAAAGAWAGGKLGAGGGAAAGAFFIGAGAGPGALIGGAIGAIGGGAAGYWGGSTAAGHLYDWVFTPLAHEEWEIVCVPSEGGGG